MNGLTLGFVAAALGLPAPGEDRPLAGVAIDGRRLRPGELFVAIPGPRFDGHDFLDQAHAAGAAAALVSRPVPGAPLPLLRVDDTRAALGRLARAWRDRFPGPVVAVTGSNGKTTVKEMAARVLAALGPVLATEGNLNNDLGLPLTLLRLTGAHRAAVVEMGANHPGEIAHLAAIAHPDVGLVTNAGPAHLEGFGSVAGVARAKGELFEALEAGQTAVINRDDPYAGLWDDLAAPARVLDFALDHEAAVRAVDVDSTAEGSRFRLLTPQGEAQVDLPLPGRHNVRNAAAAVAVGLALGVDPRAGAAALAAMTPVAGRLRPLPARGGARLIDDSYNANPASVAAALDVLAACSGRRTLGLGAMAELGAEAEALHAEVGRAARARGIERLFALGEGAAPAVPAFGPGGHHFDSMDALLETLQMDLNENDTVLVKGSRSAGMERVVQALAPQAGEG